jgi:hypothetical protein
MAGISDKALKGNYIENKFKFNGKELQNKAKIYIPHPVDILTTKNAKVILTPDIKRKN